ncbi:glutathione S-transferase [Aspergillus luchuensis]|uniref:Glutathione S-transferase n=1 Tax=Aspergillus kawachii TaxID=1069201 RepID=A0A146FAF2_ASPKA|nr:glutathione S-transferase [Aspergillus luchuensis]
MRISQKQPEITLYRGFPGTGIYTWSPFVTKLEVRLRFRGLSYRTESGSVRAAPRGKVPYVTICDEDKSGPDQARTMSDSDLIIQDLVNDDILPDLNGDLSVQEKVLDSGVRALLEDKLYFLQGYEKWMDNYYSMREHILASLPYPIRIIVGHLIYRKQYQTLHGQGTLRYSAEERSAFKKQIWEDINALLEDSRLQSDRQGPYWVLGGQHPTEADATLFGFIVGALICTACPETQAIVRGLPVLVDYAQRIHDRYFPDYELWAEK